MRTSAANTSSRWPRAEWRIASVRSASERMDPASAESCGYPVPATGPGPPPCRTAIVRSRSSRISSSRLRATVVSTGVLASRPRAIGSPGSHRAEPRLQAADSEQLAGRPLLAGGGLGRPIGALEGLDEIRSVVPHGVDGHRNGMRRQAARHGRQHRRVKLARFGVVRVEPVCPVIRRDHHGHAIVDLADIVGCLGRDNRGRPQPGMFVIVGYLLVPPELVDSGEGERPPVRSVNKVRLLACFPLARNGLPLVVAVRREDAPALGEGAPEGRLVRHRLGAGVDQPAAARGLLGPERHQAPAQYAQLTRLRLVVVWAPLGGAAAFYDRVDPLGRGHVVVRTRLRVGRGSHPVALHAELLEEFKALTRRHKTTAHANLPKLDAVWTRPVKPGLAVHNQNPAWPNQHAVNGRADLAPDD